MFARAVKAVADKQGGGEAAAAEADAEAGLNGLTRARRRFRIPFEINFQR